MALDLEAEIFAVGRIAAVPNILEVICRTTGMGFAAIARVTEDRWIACAVRDEMEFGLKAGGELKVETTICNEIRQGREAVVINNVEDSPYSTHHTPAMYGFQSYISMPIHLPDGSFFGTLCAIDPKPAALADDKTIGMFKLFAELIAFHLDANQRLTQAEASLLGERQTAELREQFIAVLGHDLRNPVASIDAGTKMLLKKTQDAKDAEILSLIRASTSRMSELIDNVLDFARGRMGSGLQLNLTADAPVEPVLHQVLAELHTSWPDRSIQTFFALSEAVHCDRSRIGQLLSNLVANALTYGDADRPIIVRALTEEGSFKLSVANAGNPIPDAALEQLFQPFSRGAVRPDQQGLGLGLYIASEIARAHGGTLVVQSDQQETCFTLQMPVKPPR